MAVEKKKLVVEASSEFNKLFADIEKLKSELAGLNGSKGGSSGSGGTGVQGTSSSFTGLKSNIIAANQAMNLFFGAIQKGRQTVQFFTKDFAFLEQRLIAFKTLTGSIGLGEDLFQSLTQLAQKTPISVSESFEGAEKLLAFGIQVNRVKDDLFALGNIAAGVGKEKLGRLILAFGQVKTATQLTGQELRQFAEAGVPLLEELAKTGTRSAAQIKEDMFRGIKPTFEDVRDAIHRMNEEGGRFNNLLNEQATTMAGLEQITSDKLGLVIAKFSELSGIADAYKKSLQAISNLFDRMLGNDGTDALTDILDRSERANKIILSLINKNNAFKGYFESGSNTTGDAGVKTFGRAAYMSLDAGSGALENLNKKKLELTNQIKTLENTIKTLNDDSEARRAGFFNRAETKEQIKVLEDELKALKVVEKEIALVANSIEQNLKVGRSELISKDDRERMEFENTLRGKSIEELKELIRLKKEELLLEKERFTTTENDLVGKDGRKGEADKKALDTIQARIKLLEKEIQLARERQSLLPPEAKDSSRFNSMMGFNPFERGSGDAMTETMKQHLRQQEIYQAELRRINNATYLDDKEKDELTQQRKEQLQEAQSTLWKYYTADALGAITSVSDVFASKSKTMFNLSKLLGIGQAGIAGFNAVNQVFADPTLSTYEKYGHAAIIAVKTAANVAQIEKLRFGGGSSKPSQSYSALDTGKSARDESEFEAMSRRADVRSASDGMTNRMLNINEQMLNSLKSIEVKE